MGRQDRVWHLVHDDLLESFTNDLFHAPEMSAFRVTGDLRMKGTLRSKLPGSRENAYKAGAAFAACPGIAAICLGSGPGSGLVSVTIKLVLPLAVSKTSRLGARLQSFIDCC